MSYDIGMKTLRLEPVERLAHTEYCSNDALARAVTGLDPRVDGATAWQRFYDDWQIDFLWSTNDGPVPWEQRGRVTDMGHAEFLEGGTDRRDPVLCPFQDVEEVLGFDAAEEYGLPDMEDLVRYYETAYQQGRKRHGRQVFPGGYYKTVVSGAIQTFGWEMLLLAAADPKRFDRVLEGFYRLTHHHVQAWAKTSAQVFICHDDMVWAQGAFMNPDFYRSAIFPRYKKLWDILHEADKIVLYCSDGDWTEFVDDIAEIGADGFIFEPMTHLDTVAERYGKTHVIMGSKVDCRTLTFGTPEAIQQEIDDTLKVAGTCSGFVFAIGNHLPSNVPVDNARFYFDYLSTHWWR